MVGCKKHFKL